MLHGAWPIKVCVCVSVCVCELLLRWVLVWMYIGRGLQKVHGWHLTQSAKCVASRMMRFVSQPHWVTNRRLICLWNCSTFLNGAHQYQKITIVYICGIFEWSKNHAVHISIILVLWINLRHCFILLFVIKSMKLFILRPWEVIIFQTNSDDSEN